MATNVTVTESHVNDRQYAGGDNYYSFTSVVNEGDVSAGVEWLGDTPNAIGTYGGESTIKANEELLFDGSALYPDASGNVALGKATETFTEIHVANLYATAGIFYDYVYIADLNTAIAKDVSNNMTFTDAVTGTKTLAELAAGGGASSPLTTKGDLWGYDTDDERIPVGTDGYALIADSSEALGVKWETWTHFVYSVQLTDDDTTDIVVGDTSDNRAITVRYSMERGGEYRSGVIDILNGGGVISDDGGTYFGDDCGLTLSADADSNGDIILSCTLDSASAGNATFEYILIYPDFSTSESPVSYTHPNHSGEVTSSGDGAQTLTVTAITNRSALESSSLDGLESTDELLISDGGVLKRMDISVIEDYMQDNLSFGGSYTHPNHSGHVTSVGDGAQTLVVAAITGQTELASGLASTDELLVSDGGVIKRMGISVLEAYMQAELSFGGTGYWDRSAGGEVTLSTAGDDIVLAVINERIVFGDGDTYIYESVDDILSIITAGGVGGTGVTYEFGVTTLSIDHASQPTLSLDVGSSVTLYFQGGTDHSYVIGSCDHLWIYSDETVNIGNSSPNTAWVTIGFTSNILTSTLLVRNASNSNILDLREDRSIYMPGLGSDDTEDHVVAIDDSTGLLTKRSVASLGGGDSVWEESSGDITPINAGSDILLAVATEWLKFGDGDSFIYESQDDYINVWAGGAHVVDFRPDRTTFYQNVTFSSSQTFDIGSSGSQVNDTWTKRILFNSSGIYITYDGTEMVFRDANNTTPVSLSDLVAGGGDSVWEESSAGLISSITADADVLVDGDLFFGGSTVWVTEFSGVLDVYTHSAIAFRFTSSGTNVSYSAILPYGNKALNLGDSLNFWDNTYVDKLYIDSTSVYIDVSGTAMALTDSTGTYSLAGFGGTIKYTTIATHTPTTNYKYINVYYSGGSTGTINIDLDAYEFADDDSSVYVSYYVSAPPGVTVNIRNSSNSVLFTESNGVSIISGTKLLAYDSTTNVWIVLV